MRGCSSNSEQQQGTGSSSDSELPLGPPVTTRIPLPPQHSFSPALLQVDILAFAPTLLTVLLIAVYKSAATTG